MLVQAQHRFSVADYYRMGETMQSVFLGDDLIECLTAVIFVYGDYS
jgi:hypothetical protein